MKSNHISKYKIGDVVRGPYSGKKFTIVGVNNNRDVKTYDVIVHFPDGFCTITYKQEAVDKLFLFVEDPIVKEKCIADGSIWNAKCPNCGAPAYKGMIKIECSEKCK